MFRTSPKQVHETCAYPTLCFGTPLTPDEENTLYNGTYRSTSVWRARNLEGTPEIQLLYGEAQLPKFNYLTRTFDLTPNVRGYIPLYGSSGFGNPNNYYSWTMMTAAGKFYVGTLDLSGQTSGTSILQTSRPTGMMAAVWAIPGTTESAPW